MSLMILALLSFPLQEEQEAWPVRESETFQETWLESGGSEFLFKPARVGKDAGFKRDLVEGVYARVNSTDVGHFRVAFGENQRVHIWVAGLQVSQSKKIRSLFRVANILEEREVASREIHEEWDGDSATAPQGYFAIRNDRKMSGEYDYLGGEFILVSRGVIITDADIRKAKAEQDLTSFDGWSVRFLLTEKGGKRFDEFAKKLYNQSPKGVTAIIMDGKIISKPVVNSEQFGGVASITGNFTRKDAESLARALVTRSLPCALKFQEERKFKPGGKKD